MSNEIAPVIKSAPAELSVAEVKSQVGKIQELMTSLMREGEHYGKIPGTDKPTLLKAGAEKLNFIFRLAPEYQITRNDHPDGHREYEIICTLKNMATGTKIAEGVGICSTMETKYRYRNIADYDVTDEPIPQDAKERKSEYRKQGYGMKRIDGNWCWVRYKDTARTENPDIADTYNTVLKMAKKRAQVDATITACAASDIFTQDVEDAIDLNGNAASAKKSAPANAPKPDYSISPTTNKAWADPSYSDDTLMAAYSSVRNGYREGISKALIARGYTYDPRTGWLKNVSSRQGVHA